MLVAFYHRNGTVQIFDTDETPAAYIFSIAERQLVASQHAEMARKRGDNKIVHCSLNDLTRPDMKGIGKEAAVRALIERLGKHKKFSRYVLQQFSIEGYNAEVKAIEPDKAFVSAPPTIVTPP